MRDLTKHNVRTAFPLSFMKNIIDLCIDDVKYVTMREVIRASVSAPEFQWIHDLVPKACFSRREESHL